MRGARRAHAGARLGSGRSRPSIEATACTSRVVEARNASLASLRSSGVVCRSSVPTSRITRSRVIEARMWSSSGGVTSVPSPSTQKIDAVGASRNPAVRRDHQRLVEAALAREL